MQRAAAKSISILGQVRLSPQVQDKTPQAPQGESPPQRLEKGYENYYDVFYVLLKSRVDKVLFALQGRRPMQDALQGQEPHAGCPTGLGKRFGQSPAGLKLPTGARIRCKKRKHPTLIFKKKNRKKREGLLCKKQDCPEILKSPNLEGIN